MDSDLIFGQKFAWMNANFACALDRVVARRSASVWRRRVEKYGVGSLLRLGRVGSPSWLSCCCGWWLWLSLFVGLLCYFYARVTIFFSYPTVRANLAME